MLASRDDLTRLSGEATEEAAADLALSVATDTVRAYCGWRVDEATETLTPAGVSGHYLLLPTLHLTDVDTVTVSGDVIADYDWDPAGYLIRAAWPAVRHVSALVTHGHSPVPPAIVGVTCALARRILDNLAGDTQGALGPLSRQLTVGWAPHERMILDRYRR